MANPPANNPPANNPPANNPQNPSNTAGSASQTASNSNTSTTNTIPQTAAAGGLTITQPPQTAAASFYKIAPSQTITFGWEFTSLLVQPTSLTVSAFCPDNGNTYPVGPTNGVIPGTATEVLWNPDAYNSQPGVIQLAEASYVLQIEDERGLNAFGTPGMFDSNTALRFALYYPQSYTPLASECRFTLLLYPAK
jgi:hypothetical protein